MHVYSDRAIELRNAFFLVVTDTPGARERLTELAGDAVTGPELIEVVEAVVEALVMAMGPEYEKQLDDAWMRGAGMAASETEDI